MPDVLIVSADNQQRFELEELIAKAGARWKSVIDSEGALQWLKNWSFDLIVTDTALPIAEQLLIADLFWATDPAGRFVNIAKSALPPNAEIAGRLFGAEVLKGPGALAALSELVKSLGPKEASSFDHFEILVVDDLDSPRDVICSFIESMGFPKVSGVNAGKAALELLTANPKKFSCVVTDIRMPDMNGATLTEQIRLHANLRSLPVIVLTAYGSADMLLDCLRAGASGFLVKPPKREDLSRELRRAYRIVRNKLVPRLAVGEEVEQVRIVLEERGLV